MHSHNLCIKGYCLFGLPPILSARSNTSKRSHPLDPSYPMSIYKTQEVWRVSCCIYPGDPDGPNLWRGSFHRHWRWDTEWDHYQNWDGLLYNCGLFFYPTECFLITMSIDCFSSCSLSLITCVNSGLYKLTLIN